MTNSMPTNTSLPGNPLQGASTIDIDEDNWFAAQAATLTSPSAKNFAVAFDTASARLRVNLDTDELTQFVDTDSQDGQVRWINFWSCNNDYKPAVDRIARKYKISPRLVSLIWPGVVSSPPMPSLSPSSSGDAGNNTLSAPGRPLNRRSSLSIRRYAKPIRSKNYGRELPLPPRESGFGKIAAQLWHFCSVDYGAHYMHIGFNQLYTPPLPAEQADDADDGKPLGVRLWTSIILCEDGTVFSVFEPPPLLLNDEGVARYLRRSVLNILRNLSRRHVPGPEEELYKVSIRPPHTSSDPNTTASLLRDKALGLRTGMASLLFYYLFDDWLTSYALISGGDHPYRARLEKIRKTMFRTADIDSVHALHEVGRQLGVLRLMYKSYELIVNRLIEAQRLQDGQARRGVQRFVLEPAFTGDDGIDETGANDALANGSRVKLSVSSVVRFERLQDRIRLYALTEIDNCLKEKEELVFMNFNLVALNESQAVEKLTRTTILLAKVTVVFLPISLMTAYFGISIGEIEQIYSLQTYWLSFLVVIIVSLIFLVSFGLVSYKVSDGLGYTSFAKWLWDQRKAKKKNRGRS